MLVTFVFVYLTMDLTKAFDKHQFIIDSLTNPLAFAGQQMKVTPVHGFNEAITKLCIMLKPNLAYEKALKECGKGINIDHYITLVINRVHSQCPQRSYFQLVFTIKGNHMFTPLTSIILLLEQTIMSSQSSLLIKRRQARLTSM